MRQGAARQQTIVKLFLCATNVQTAKVKIFQGKDIGLEHLLASTCLPLLMQAVEGRRRILLGWQLRRESWDLSADLRLRRPRHPHDPHHASRALGSSDHLTGDYESDAGDQFQHCADTGNADARSF
jgi:hypothetical protein